jgi:hypothetical protein
LCPARTVLPGQCSSEDTCVLPELSSLVNVVGGHLCPARTVHPGQCSREDTCVLPELSTLVSVVGGHLCPARTVLPGQYSREVTCVSDSQFSREDTCVSDSQCSGEDNGVLPERSSLVNVVGRTLVSCQNCPPWVNVVGGHLCPARTVHPGQCSREDTCPHRPISYCTGLETSGDICPHRVIF